MTATRLSSRQLGMLVTFVSLLLSAVIFSGTFRKPFEPSARTVTANFERAPQLRKGSQVRLEGNVEGKVTDIAANPGGRGVRVKMDVRRDAGPIYADAHARVGFKTLLGGVFYVALDRGTSTAGMLGDRVIPLRNTSVQNELEDLTGALRDGAVTGLQTLPGQLAEGLADDRAPARALSTLTDVAPQVGAALRAVRGTRPADDLPEVVSAAADTVKALDSGNDDLRTLVSGAAATLQVTGRRSAEIQATLDAAPAVTDDMTRTFARLDRTLLIARGLVDRLIPAAPQVAPTLNALRPTLGETGKLLRDAKPIARTLPGTLATLASASRHLVPLIDGIEPALGRIDRTILPYLRRNDSETGKPTSVMIGGFAAGFGGSAGQQDANGHFIRFPASVGASTVYLPCKSSLIDPGASSRLACDTFNKALTNYLEYLPDIGQGAPR